MLFHHLQMMPFMGDALLDGMTDALIPLVQLMFKVGLEHREHERQSLLQVVQMLQGVSKMGNQESSCGSRVFTLVFDTISSTHSSLS